MNFPKSTLIVLLTSILFVSCKEKTTENGLNSSLENDNHKVKKEIATANLQTASFTIKGMTCAIGCAKTIEQELNGLDGVKTATVNFDNGLATVSYDKTALSPKELTKVVEATADGKTYKVSDIKL